MHHLDRFEALHSKTPWAPKNLIDRAKGSSAQLLDLVKDCLGNCKVEVFSSCEEAFTQFIFGLVESKAIGEGKNHLLIPENLSGPYRAILSKFEPFGVVLQTIPLNGEGVIDLELLADAFYPTTMGVILEPVDWITGLEQPLDKVLEICKNRCSVYIASKALVGMDRLPRNIGALLCDNALFVDETMDVSGSKDPDLVYAITSQMVESFCNRTEEGMQLIYLRRLLERGIESMGGKIFFKTNQRDPGTLLFGFEHIHGELLAYWLCQRGVFVSIGGGPRPSLHRHLSRMGFIEKEALTAVHASLTPGLEEKGIYQVLSILEECIRLAKRPLKVV
jgi:cysteine sulfinate desulfinase/cysteine desulfurase-like protein